MRLCKDCNQEKKLTEFNRDKYTGKVGTRVCKECTKVRNAEYYAANKGKERKAKQRNRTSSLDALTETEIEYLRRIHKVTPGQGPPRKQLDRPVKHKVPDWVKDLNGIMEEKETG